MSSRQRKAALLVFRESECRWLEPLNSVTLLTLVEPGRCSELRLVLVMMAVQAVAELHFENRVLAFGDMTLRAFQLGMPTRKRILRSRVRL